MAQIKLMAERDLTGMHMRCACLGHMSSVSTAVDKTRHALWPLFHWFAFLFFCFFPFWFFCLSMSGHCGRRRGLSAASTIIAVSGLAGACPRSCNGCPSSSTVIASTPPASVAESFSRDNLLVLVRDEFTRLMQQ